jgi:UDP:flavonoid glycosyltransferase YjiC (YdhE family)
MNITILTIGSRGDVQPLVALGKGLKEAGHIVRIGTDAAFETLTRGVGLDFTPVAGDIRSVMQSAGGREMLDQGQNPLIMIGTMIEAARPLAKRIAEDFLNAAQDADGLILGGVAFFGGTAVAEKLNIPFIPASYMPVYPTRAFAHPLFTHRLLKMGGALNRLSADLITQAFWQASRPVLNQGRSEVLGLGPAAFFGPYREMDRQRIAHVHGYSTTVVPRPPDYPDFVHITGYWFLDADPNWQPTKQLLDFLATGPAPVCIGFGSMSNEKPEEVTEVLVEALQMTGQRGILLTGWEGLRASTLPDTVFLLHDAPHDWLFPRMAAVVHHGGCGTTAAGLRAGVPSILIPFFGDQPFWAQQIHRLGAGPSPIPRKALTAKRLAEAIQLAVNDYEMQVRCQVIAQKIQAENGIQQAIQVIEHSFTASRH